MSSLLLRLSGPMQSWGTKSRFSQRDTGLEPSKSGVMGLIGAAMGVARNDKAFLEKMAWLSMAVRVDREGRLMRDFQTAGGGKWPGLDDYGVIKADGSAPGTVISDRYYLADAVFLVALGGPCEILKEIDQALLKPVWPLYLGRKSFVPAETIRLPDGLSDDEPELVLRRYRLLNERSEVPSRLRLVLECAPGRGQRRSDIPISFDPTQRSYQVRYVQTDWVATEALEGGAQGCFCPV